MPKPEFASVLQQDIYYFLQQNPGSTPTQIATALGRKPRGILTSLSFMGQFSHHLVNAGDYGVEVVDSNSGIIGVGDSYFGLQTVYYATSFPHTCRNTEHAT